MTTSRITQKELENAVDGLNEAKGIRHAGWNKVGCYQLEFAYGGVKLVEVVSEGGGQRDISRNGFGTKRELMTFIYGMQA